MARKTQPLTVTLYYGGERIETLTEEQRTRIGDRLSRQMSLYYSKHISEYLALCEADEKREGMKEQK